jgi:uncharacterized protein (DUF58 family)
MKSPKPRHPIERLDILCSIAVAALAVGSIAGAWTFYALIAWLLLVVVYGVFRDLRALSASKKPAHAQSTVRTTHAERSE